MRNIESRKLLLPDRLALAESVVPGPADLAPFAPPLVSVLWGRRRAFALTVLVCIVGAALYLLAATRVYRATTTLFVQQNAPRAFSDGAGASAPSDTYLQSQADILLSTP